MTVNNLTHEQVIRNMKEALNRLLPAKLADKPVNGAVVQAFMLKHPDDFIPATVDAFYRAFLAVQADLIWEIEPASLAAASKNATQDVTSTLALFDEYSRGFAPADLLRTDANASTMINYVLDKYRVVTISYLIAAERALGTQLQRTPPVHVPTKTELAIAAEKKMRKDYLDSIKPQETLEQSKLGQARLNENAKAAIEKQIKNVNAEIESSINSYFVANPNRGIDYGKTESGLAALRSTCDKYPRRTSDLGTAKNCLEAVKAVKYKL